MSAVEKIMIAEEKVAGLQNQLSVVESVLEKAEYVAVSGEKAGRGLRRFVRILLLLSVVAAIVLVIKKVMGDGCPMGKKTDEAVVADPSDDAPTNDETATDGDADAS